MTGLSFNDAKPGVRVREPETWSSHGPTGEGVIVEAFDATETTKSFAWVAMLREYNYEENSGPWYEIESHGLRYLELMPENKS